MLQPLPPLSFQMILVHVSQIFDTVWHTVSVTLYLLRRRPRWALLRDSDWAPVWLIQTRNSHLVTVLLCPVRHCTAATKPSKLCARNNAIGMSVPSGWPLNLRIWELSLPLGRWTTFYLWRVSEPLGILPFLIVDRGVAIDELMKIFCDTYFSLSRTHHFSLHVSFLSLPFCIVSHYTLQKFCTTWE